MSVLMPVFTFSSRQQETRWELCEGYINLVRHVFDLFLSYLKALGKISVIQSRVEGNENVSTLSRSSCTRVWMSTFVRTSSRLHLAESLDKYLRQECKPDIISILLICKYRMDTFSHHCRQLLASRLECNTSYEHILCATYHIRCTKFQQWQSSQSGVPWWKCWTS